MLQQQQQQQQRVDQQWRLMATCQQLNHCVMH